MKTILIFILLMVGSTLGLFWYQYMKFNDGRLHVVFCAVGQGDAIYIRTPEGSDIILDGGPDQSVLRCLRDHMPFWDRTIELMLLSHPHADHLVGLLSLLKRYTIVSFDTERLRNETAMYTALLDLLAKQKTHTRYVLAGDRFTTRDGVVLRILSPSPEYLEITSPGGLIGEKKEFASLIMQVSYGNFDVLLTGDSQKEAFLRPDIDVRTVEVLQSPHHGSKTGLGREMLGKINPQLVVISVGKNNYGHPSKETLDILNNEHIRAVRTDTRGDIEIVSNGHTWSLRE